MFIPPPYSHSLKNYVGAQLIWNSILKIFACILKR